MKSRNVLIEAHHLTQVYSGKTALDVDAFRVCAGEFVAILGGSGSGKSTFLRLLAGIETPTRGGMNWFDRDGQITKHRPLMMWQSLALFPSLSVGQNIAFGLKARRIPSERRRKLVNEMLDRVELPGYDDRHISTLSGGELRRVALARALV